MFGQPVVSAAEGAVVDRSGGGRGGVTTDGQIGRTAGTVASPQFLAGASAALEIVLSWMGPTKVSPAAGVVLVPPVPNPNSGWTLQSLAKCLLPDGMGTPRRRFRLPIRRSPQIAPIGGHGRSSPSLLRSGPIVASFEVGAARVGAGNPVRRGGGSGQGFNNRGPIYFPPCIIVHYTDCLQARLQSPRASKHAAGPKVNRSSGGTPRRTRDAPRARSSRAAARSRHAFPRRDGRTSHKAIPVERRAGEAPRSKDCARVGTAAAQKAAISSSRPSRWRPFGGRRFRPPIRRTRPIGGRGRSSSSLLRSGVVVAFEIGAGRVGGGEPCPPRRGSGRRFENRGPGELPRRPLRGGGEI